MGDCLTLAELRRPVRQLKGVKGFDNTLEQRLAYVTTEVGDVAREVLRISWGENEDVGRMARAKRKAVVKNLGMET